VGTNPLPRKGSKIRNIGELLAVSTLLEVGDLLHGHVVVAHGRPHHTHTAR
jgi:hypothetical protein